MNVTDLKEKEPVENKKIGPLVQMLKTLDDKGLLQECMQHYIDIQTSYDNQNEERRGSKEISGQLYNGQRKKSSKMLPNLIDSSH